MSIFLGNRDSLTFVPMPLLMELNPAVRWSSRRDHVSRRIAKLAWPYHREKIWHEAITGLPPVWLTAEADFDSEAGSLPLAAVEYALHCQVHRDELVSVMPYLLPEAVLLAYGHIVATQPLYRDGDDALRWVLGQLENLGYTTSVMATSDTRAYFTDINAVHCRRLPTGLLLLRYFAGVHGWPEAVHRELRLREGRLYRVWAHARVVILGVASQLREPWLSAS